MPEESLRRAREELNLRVKERTRELRKTNADLHREVEKRKQIETELRPANRLPPWRLLRVTLSCKIPSWATFSTSPVFLRGKTQANIQSVKLQPLLRELVDSFQPAAAESPS